MIQCSKFVNLGKTFVTKTLCQSVIVIGRCNLSNSPKYSQFCNIKDYRRYNVDFRRFYGEGKGGVRKLEDDYYLKETDSGSETYLLGVTRNKFKDFKELVYINITDEERLNKGDYLFSVEDSKTLFDFYSPLDCKIQDVNPKFMKGVGERELKDLLECPEREDNYLVKVNLKKD